MAHIVVLGAGIGGISMAYELKEADSDIYIPSPEPRERMSESMDH